MNKYNLETLSDFLEIDRTVDEVCQWFDAMVQDYNAKKQEGISDIEMYRLFDFWKNIQHIYGNTIYNILNEHWAEEPIEMLKDFHEFAPQYHEMHFNNIMNELDDVEKEEVKSLIDEIWNTNQRLDLSFSYYDYNIDTFSELSMQIPRLTREKAKMEFSVICAQIILNRGHLLVKIYKPRGQVEYAAISVNENGLWGCLSESEIATVYSNDKNKPLQMQNNEKVIFFNHPMHTKFGENVRKYENEFNIKYS